MANIKYATPVLLSLAGCATPNLKTYVTDHTPAEVKRLQEYDARNRRLKTEEPRAVGIEEVVAPRSEATKVEPKGESRVYITVEPKTARYMILEEDLRKLETAAAYNQNTGKGFDKDTKKFTQEYDPNNDEHLRSLDRLLNDSDEDRDGIVRSSEVENILKEKREEAYQNATEGRVVRKFKIGKGFVEERVPYDEPVKGASTSTTATYAPDGEPRVSERKPLRSIAPKEPLNKGQENGYKNPVRGLVGFTDDNFDYGNAILGIALYESGKARLSRIVTVEDNEKTTCSLTGRFSAHGGDRRFNYTLERVKKRYSHKDTREERIKSKLDSICNRAAWEQGIGPYGKKRRK